MQSKLPEELLLELCIKGDGPLAMKLLMQHCSTTSSFWQEYSSGVGRLELQDRITHDGTPLFWACSHGFNDLAHGLVALGASVNAASICNGSSPLHVAADHGRVDIIRSLHTYIPCKGKGAGVYWLK